MSTSNCKTASCAVALSNSELVTIIDEADLPLAGLHAWYLSKSGHGQLYVRASVRCTNGRGQTFVLLHRLLMDAPKGMIVDHKNGDPLDNRCCNLRICTHAENMRNSKVRSSSKSGERNLTYTTDSRGRSRWRVCITFDGKRYRKWFRIEGDAAAWAAMKRKELHGEFAVDFRES